MKTIVLKPLKEIKIWLSIFLIGNLINVVSIMGYKTSWNELYTQLDFVFFMSCFLYLLVIIFRMMVWFFKNLKERQSQVRSNK